MAIVQALPAAPPSAPSARRDTGVDFIRALCVVGVVLLHAIMVGVTVVDGAPVFENASDGTGWIAPLSWVLQVMPLFFVIGGFSGLLAYRRLRAGGASALGFLSARVHRLLRPAVVTIAVVGVALAVLTLLGVPAELIAVAGFRYSQPLWFLGVFLLCQVLLPAMVWLHDRAPLRTIGALTAVAVAVDLVRGTTGAEAIGFLNLAFVWLALQQLGFFLADGRIDALPRRIRVAAIAGAGVLLVSLFLVGAYSPDLIANINPPTAALLLVGIVHTGLLSLHRERIGRVSGHAVAAAFTSFVTRRTMTVYLWHMPVLLAMAGLTAVAALTTDAVLPALDSPEWWLARPLWMLSALALTAAVAVAVDRFEREPAPLGTRSRGRLVAAALLGLGGVVLLLVVGTSVTTAVVAVALLLAALRLARTTSPAPARVAAVAAPA